MQIYRDKLDLSANSQEIFLSDRTQLNMKVPVNINWYVGVCGKTPPHTTHHIPQTANQPKMARNYYRARSVPSGPHSACEADDDAYVPSRQASGTFPFRWGR